MLFETEQGSGNGESADKMNLSIRAMLSAMETSLLPIYQRDLLVNTNTPEEWQSAMDKYNAE